MSSIRYDELHKNLPNFYQEVHAAFDKYQHFFLDNKAKIMDAYHPEKVTEKDIAENFVSTVNFINNRIFENNIFARYDCTKDRIFLSDASFQIYGIVRPCNMDFSWMSYYDNFEVLIVNIRAAFQKLIATIVFISDFEKEYFMNKIMCTLIEYFDENLHIEEIYDFSSALEE